MPFTPLTREDLWKQYAPKQNERINPLREPLRFGGRMLQYLDAPVLAAMYTKGVLEKYPEKRPIVARLFRKYLNDPTLTPDRLARDFPVSFGMGAKADKYLNLGLAYGKTIGLNPITWGTGPTTAMRASANPALRIGGHVLGTLVDPFGTVARGAGGAFRMTRYGRAVSLARSIARNTQQAIDAGLTEQAILKQGTMEVARITEEWANRQAMRVSGGRRPTLMGIRNPLGHASYVAKLNAAGHLSSIADEGYNAFENWLTANGLTRRTPLDAAQRALAQVEIDAAQQAQIARLAGAHGYDPADLASAYQRMMQAEQRIGDRMAQLQIISPETAEIWATMHLRRAYERFDDFESWLDNADPLAAAQARGQYRQGGAGTGPVKWAARAPRRSIDPAIRASLGEEENALVRFMQGQEYGGRSIAGASAAERVGAAWDMPTLDPATHLPPGGIDELEATTPGIPWVQIPDNAKWGPLRGRYVPMPAAEQLIQQFDPKQEGFRAMGLLGRANTAAARKVAQMRGGTWANMVNQWKFFKVVALPGAWSRNVQSNMWRAYTELGLKPHEFIANFHPAFRAIRNNTPEWQAAKMQGLTLNETLVGSETFRDTAYRMHHLGGVRGMARDLNATWRAGKDWMTDRYGEVELASKYAIVRALRKRGMSLPDAVAGAERALFTPSKTPPIIKWLSATGLSPFATYRYNASMGELNAMTKAMYRFNNLRRTGQFLESLSSVPEEDRMMGKKNNLRSLRGGLHLWMPDAVSRVYEMDFQNPDIQPHMWDVSYVAPALPNVPMGPAPQLGAMDWYRQQVFANLGPQITVPAQILLNRRAGSEQPIYRELGERQAAEEVGKFLWQSYGPTIGPYGYAWDTVKQSLNKGRKVTGEPYTPTSAVASSLFGVKMNTVTRTALAKQYAFEREELKKKRDEAQRGLLIKRQRGALNTREWQVRERERRDLAVHQMRGLIQRRRRPKAAIRYEENQ